MGTLCFLVCARVNPSDRTPPEAEPPLLMDMPESGTSADDSPASLDPSAQARGISSPVTGELLDTFSPHLNLSLIPVGKCRDDCLR